MKTTCTRRWVGAVATLALVLPVLACDGEFSEFAFSESRLIGATLSPGPKHLFMDWEIDDQIVMPAGKLELSSGGITGGGGRLPKKILLFLTRIDANGRAADSFKLVMKVEADGNFKPARKKFQGMEFAPGDHLEARFKLRGGTIPAFSTVALDLEYKAN